VHKEVQHRNNGVKIIHVTESLGGGVLNSLIGLIGNQVSDGYPTEIHYVERFDTPSIDELKNLFGQQTIIMTYGKSNLINIVKLFKKIKISTNEMCIIHLHSSKAGLVGRLMLRKHLSKTLYSPHAFAFTRRDIPGAMRTIYRMLEYFSDQVSNYKTLGVSKHESLLASNLNFRNVETLYNYISDPVLEFGLTLSPCDRRIFDVCNLARISPQKNPARFSRIFRVMQGPGKWIWIGAGESNYIENNFDIEVTEWKSRSDSMKYLNNSKIFLSTSDWEGLSVSLIEAQMMGLPAIAWDIPSNREIIQNGESGYLCSTENEMALRIQEILNDTQLWKYLSKNARSNAILNFERSHNLHAWKIAYFE
jgi:glycosyltransferase involved in cell wall biosynthesis